MKPAFCLVLAVALPLGGCAIGPMTPLNAMLYTDVTYPSAYQGASTEGPGPKKGTSQATNVLGLIATGDASVAAACSHGGITKIHTVDHHGTNVLGLWATFSTIVTGE